MTDQATATSADRRELISFRVGEQEYCVDIMAVREIRPWSASTPLPGVPAYVRGVVNLRGVVLPVCDLGERLGWGRSEPTERHVIIVATIEGQLVGLMADGVSDILTFDRAMVQSAGDLGVEAVSFLEGLVPQEGHMLLLLALERLGLAEAVAEAA